jgi:hypothetical protein
MKFWMCDDVKEKSWKMPTLFLAIVIIVPPPPPSPAGRMGKHLHDAQGEERVRERRAHFWLGMVGLETNEKTMNLAGFQSVETQL